MSGLPYVVSGGHKRFLACLPAKEDFGGLPKFLAAPGATLIPRSEWKPVNNRWRFDASFILDQNGHGSCVGNGSAAALRKVRILAGQPDVKLSPACLYAQINNGVDQGAVISDALTALQQTGTCRFDLVGQDPVYLPQLPAGWEQDAQRFTIRQAYHCANYDEIGSAIQLGYVVVYGIMVGNSFTNFDKYGVAGHARGPGNHCMHADGMTPLADGRWALDNCNSWASSFGPWNNGRCYLDEDHFGHGDVPDAFAIEFGSEDPQNPQPLPHLSTFGIHRPSPRTH